MDFALADEQMMLTESLGRLLADCAPLARTRRFAEQDEARAGEVWQALTELGVPGLAIAERHGGSGLGLLDCALAAETLGRHVAPVPFVASSVMAPLALSIAGSPAQQAEWLPRIASGRTVCGAALSEHCGARENAGVTLHDGRLQGRALFVLDFAADAYLVASSTGALHWVTADAPGLVREALITIDRTRRSGALVFDNVAAEALPGSADGAALRRVLDAGRIALAADTLGAAQHMLEAAVTYAGQREQFGRIVASFQAVKHLCAEMAAALEPARAMLWYAAHAQDHLPDEAHLQALQVKAHLAEVGTFVARTATEVHGGVGFTDLLGLHYWFKRIGVNRQLLGGPEWLRQAAAVAQGYV